MWAGGNAINSMIESGMQGVEFVAVNTDAQDLRVKSSRFRNSNWHEFNKRSWCLVQKRDRGLAAADESLNEIVGLHSSESNTIFITSGMGGGTGIRCISYY